jgi:predicted metalloprotease with PDZ domain
MDPVIAARRALPWRDWQRSEDYYSEGLLIWLDADTLIRERTNGSNSLDQFGLAFFGMNDGDWGQLTYTYDDVIDTMHTVHAMDWRAFFDARVHELSDAPLAGIERGGYRLVFRDEPNSVTRAVEARTRSANHAYSIGLSVSAAGKITAVGWDTPAFTAGLTTAATITAVNGQPFSQEQLANAISATASAPAPVRLTTRTGDVTQDVVITYQGGLRYPALEPIPGRPALLDQIFEPR